MHVMCVGVREGGRADGEGYGTGRDGRSGGRKRQTDGSGWRTDERTCRRALHERQDGGRPGAH